MKQPSIDERADNTLAEAQTTLRLLAGSVLKIRRCVLEELLCIIGHYRDQAAAPRYAEYDLQDRPEKDLVGTMRADRMEPGKPEYRCGKCQSDFAWNGAYMVWMCSRAESCPLCSPLCGSCLETEDKKQRAEKICPLSGLPVVNGNQVTCECGARFENVRTIPRHGAPFPKGPAPEIDVAKEIEEAIIALESLNDGRDLTDLRMARDLAVEQRLRVEHLEQDLHELRQSIEDPI